MASTATMCKQAGNVRAVPVSRAQHDLTQQLRWATVGPSMSKR